MSTASLKPLHTPVQPRGKQPTRGDGGHGRGRPWGQGMGAGQPGPCAPPQPQVLPRSAGGLAPWGSSQEQFLVLAAAPLLKRDKKWVLKGDAVMPMLRLCTPRPELRDSNPRSPNCLRHSLATAAQPTWLVAPSSFPEHRGKEATTMLERGPGTAGVGCRTGETKALAKNRLLHSVST